MNPYILNKQKKGNILIGVIWTLFSALFVIIGIWITVSALKKSMWEEVPCEVTSLKVKANKNIQPPFQPEVSYKYKFDNASYTGDQISHGEDGERDFEKLGKLLEQHRKGEIKVCYVNPENPEDATLRKQPAIAVIMGIAFTAFGIFFVLIGLFIMRQNAKKASPITRSGKGDLRNSVMVPFFSIFAVIGCVMMFFFVKSAMSAKTSENWQKAPAQVIWSRVLTISGDDSTTYRPEIFYRYEFNGVKYRSNSYKASKSSSSGYSSKEKIVKAHPRGKKFTCFVNPEKPWQALVDPKMGLGWLWLLFPVPFIAVGVGGLIATFRKKGPKRRTKKNSSVATRQKTTPDAEDREIVFSPGKKRIFWFFIAIAIAVFWNGIMSLFLKDLLSDGESGGNSWGDILFFLPFGLIGIALIIHIPYRFLAIFNPSAIVTLAEPSIVIGTNTKVIWQIPSGAHKIKRFRIYLKGAEKAQYRRGTDTKTATSTFYEHSVIDTQNPRESAKGSVDILLPEQATNIMPSWEGIHNSIIWTLEVKGEIPLWPDVSESYPITISPPTLTTQA